MKKVKGLDCILLIDDEEANHFINQVVIRKAKLETHVQIAYDGIEALDYLTCKGKFSDEPNFPQPGLILLDINMPRMNGWEFLEKYDKLPSEQKGKIVLALLTTSSNPDDAQTAERNKDVMTFMIKPLTLEVFEKVVAENFDE